MTGIQPAAGAHPGTVAFDVLFEAQLGANEFTLKVPVTTTEGYTDAVIKACQALHAGLVDLARAVKDQETGPHIPTLFTLEDGNPE
ncbi:hypothetical protein F1643_13335 [Azospirillum sp. INR13]|nr:hypothetical protein [Azospirillum sp. INR13]